MIRLVQSLPSIFQRTLRHFGHHFFLALVSRNKYGTKLLEVSNDNITTERTTTTGNCDISILLKGRQQVTG
jgi:hypothetical protein